MSDELELLACRSCGEPAILLLSHETGPYCAFVATCDPCAIDVLGDMKRTPAEARQSAVAAWNASVVPAAAVLGAAPPRHAQVPEAMQAA